MNVVRLLLSGLSWLLWTIALPFRRGRRIKTYTGREIDLFGPSVVDIDILDIAHALALQCRFNGHCRVFYSVAQHSVIVSWIVPPRLALQALLHDVAEAYVGDMVRPLKRQISAFGRVEAIVHAVCMARFGLPVDLDDAVKAADDAALVTEARDLMPAYPNGFDVKALPLAEKIVPMSPAEAEAAFLDRFYELTADMAGDRGLSWS